MSSIYFQRVYQGYKLSSIFHAIEFRKVSHHLCVMITDFVYGGPLVQQIVGLELVGSACCSLHAECSRSKQLKAVASEHESNMYVNPV